MTNPVKILILFTIGGLIGFIGQHFHVPFLLTCGVGFLFGWNFDNILNLFKKNKK